MGRKKIYTSNAEKCRAYRIRRKLKRIQQLGTYQPVYIEPVIKEKIPEQLIPKERELNLDNEEDLNIIEQEDFSRYCKTYEHVKNVILNRYDSGENPYIGWFCHKCTRGNFILDKQCICGELRPHTEEWKIQDLIDNIEWITELDFMKQHYEEYI